MEAILRWLKWASGQRIEGNRAGDAKTFIEALQQENWALEGKMEAKNALLTSYREDRMALKGLLRDIWADLDQSAKRAGTLNWMPSEIRKETAAKLMHLYGPFGKGKGKNV